MTTQKSSRSPGLYELLFYERLQCCSPSCVAKLLTDVARDFDDSIEEFRVLDVGAGNGMVGDELSHLGVDQVFGVDITPSARKATNGIVPPSTMVTWSPI